MPDLRNLARLALALLWGGLGSLLDALRQIGGVGAGLIVTALLALAFLAASLLQRRLVGRLAANPAGRVSWLDLEVWFSLPGLLWLPIHGVIRLARALAAWLRRRREPPPAETAPPQPAPALLVATLGPSFLLSGIGIAGLQLLGLALEPALRSRLALSPGYPAWQYVFLGRREELAWYVPLQQFPFLAGLLTVLFWLCVWWWGGRLVRLAAIGRLGRNLAAEREQREVLASWREWFGAGFLAAPDPSYSRWAAWTLAAGAVLLAGAWFSLDGRPYRVEASHFAAVLVLWLSWAVHLRLRGLDRPAEAPADPAEAPQAAVAGWPELAAYLREHLQIEVPPPFEAPRPVAPLPWSEADPASDSVLSPLVAELLPEPRRLTVMQRAILADLSLQAFVHLEPPAAAGELKLAAPAGEALEDRSGLRSRNVIVLAPEGAGKTTLALLAAANHAVVHTRSTLVVARDAAQEERIYDAFRAAVEPSTLRWNLRIRRFGGDLMADLSQGIAPDLVVCSLHDLATGLLESAEAFSPFLRNLGLIVVDDVESFAGPVEIHAQIAFRRLTLRVRRLRGVRELGERSAPQMLLFGAETMHDPAAWARSLCGIDAVARHFSHSGGSSEQPADSGHHQVFFRLADFRTAAHGRFGAAELIAACERLEVPWHYRLCGDGRRELGRAPLCLPEEPKQYRPAPEEACVVLLEGPWSAVRRERNRLGRAGARFAGPDPIAVVTLCDPDEETAFTQLDRGFSLAAPLAALPRPIVRPPSGGVVLGHLSAELTQGWLETGEVLEAFGEAMAPRLMRLAEAGFLLTEERLDVDPQAVRYRKEVYVRALATAVGEAGMLPDKVTQVERAADRAVAVRDRTRLSLLAWADPGAADFTYYPGRIFADARGTFVVVGRTPEEVLAEPFLADDVSSPRREIRLEESGAPLAGPDPVILGRHPLRVALRPVVVSAVHHATFRLSPLTREVRQKVVQDDEARRVRTAPLATVALAIHPNPSPEAPALRLAEARLLAAALRALLPSVIRGAAEGLAVALRVEGRELPADHPLAPEDGFFLFDLDAGGNGIAQALHRDGVELILRLARLMIERVLDPGGLLRLHDHWADEREILAEEPDAAGGPARFEALRHGLLAWLDSRLRLEGGDAAAPLAGPGSGSEPGEGDLIDLGRCWYSRDGAVTDLVWARHRWLLPERGEALLDVAFDRRTVAVSRLLTEDEKALAAYQAALAERLEGDWGTAHPVLIRVPGQDEPRISDEGCKAEPLPVFHALASAVFAQSWTALAPLAEALRERSGLTDPLGLAFYLARFVQGIPYSEPRAVRGGLRPPVSTLLYRIGDCDSKALLLATLLDLCGIESGLFVSFAERHAVAAVSIPGVEATREAAFWAEVEKEGEAKRIFLPVECTAYRPIGAVSAADPASWALLPFEVEPLGLDWDHLSPWDRAEQEGRF